MTTPAEIERHLSEQRRSGKSAVAYCEERGIQIGKFYGWKKRRKEPPARFARVQTSITVEIEVGAAKLLVPLEALNAVLSELNNQ
jgi:hypothetical protein